MISRRKLFGLTALSALGAMLGRASASPDFSAANIVTKKPIGDTVGSMRLQPGWTRYEYKSASRSKIFRPKTRLAVRRASQ